MAKVRADAVRAAKEDAADRRTFRKVRRALAEGREIALPHAYAVRLMAGETAALVFRNWRGKKQTEVADAIGISRRRLSDIEAGRREDTPELRKALARVLNVPVETFEGFGPPR